VILQQQQRDALLQQWQEEAWVNVDAWEKEHKGENENPRTSPTNPPP
jgi:hypothetical protein